MNIPLRPHLLAAALALAFALPQVQAQTALSIPATQGSGSTSPYAGSLATTTGVVTKIKKQKSNRIQIILECTSTRLVVCQVCLDMSLRRTEKTILIDWKLKNTTLFLKNILFTKKLNNHG